MELNNLKDYLISKDDKVFIKMFEKEILNLIKQKSNLSTLEKKYSKFKDKLMNLSKAKIEKDNLVKANQIMNEIKIAPINNVLSN